MSVSEEGGAEIPTGFRACESLEKAGYAVSTITRIPSVPATRTLVPMVM